VLKANEHLYKLNSGPFINHTTLDLHIMFLHLRLMFGEASLPRIVAWFVAWASGWRHGDIRRAASAWVSFHFVSSLQFDTSIRLSVW
jgi:Na+(H+)/acetate symporter ActP